MFGVISCIFSIFIEIVNKRLLAISLSAQFTPKGDKHGCDDSTGR